LPEAKALAGSLGVELTFLSAEDAQDIEQRITSFGSQLNGGLVLPLDSGTENHRDLVITLTQRHGLPTISSERAFVRAGGLMSYGTDVIDHYRQAAYYVDRILRGDKPADLPVQAPVKYRTVLNLETAKALGLTVPPALLVAADEVIE